MSPYIVNLTDHLIGKHGYDEFRLSSDEFRKHVALDLWIDDIARMKPAKHGQIMASFETGDVVAHGQELFDLCAFNGNCGDLLLKLVSACLAYAIWGRLFMAEEYGMPPYQRGRRTA